MSDSSSNSGGINFLGLLQVLFIGLKLTGYVTWSWVWVLSPLWIPIALLSLLAAIAGIVYVIVGKN